MITIRRVLPALGIVASAAFLSMAEAQLRVGHGPANAARGPAPTITRPATPTKAPDAEGFIRRWLVLEPIRRQRAHRQRRPGRRQEGVLPQPVYGDPA